MIANFGVTGQYCRAVLSLPSPLRALHGGTRNNLKQALDNFCRLPSIRELQTWQPDVFATDKLCADRAGANNAAIYVWYADSADISRIRTPCHAQGRGFACCAADLTRVIALSLIVRSTLATEDFVGCICVVLLFASGLTVLDSAPLPSIFPHCGYRDAFLQQTLPGTNVGLQFSIP